MWTTQEGRIQTASEQAWAFICASYSTVHSLTTGQSISKLLRTHLRRITHTDHFLLIQLLLSLTRGSCSCPRISWVLLSLPLVFLFYESESCLAVSDSLQSNGIVHGILQARILEWVAIPFSRGSSQPRDQPRSPALQADSLPAEPPGKPFLFMRKSNFILFLIRN